MKYALDAAEIEWRDGTPFSTRYGDIYWSRGNPAAEKKHVFVDKHDLVNRGEYATHFTIVETGFGFGNNFLLTAKQWKDAGHHGILHFISIENTPVKRKDLARHFSAFPLENADWLLEHYPPLLNTSFTLWLGDSIRLHLIFDDVLNALDHLDARVDAWYLDGFSPALNADIWNQKVYGRIHSLSKPGATLSTYSVAGHVRRGLTHAGFDTRKIPGHGAKAEMLVAAKSGDWQADIRENVSVAILGAGIAGSSCAQALHRRGISVTLFDRADAGAASNIPDLSVYPHLGLRNEGRYQLSLAANFYARYQMTGYNPGGLTWRSSDPEQADRMHRIAAQFPDDFIESDTDSIRFHQAGSLNHSRPAEIDYRQCDVASVKPLDRQWALIDSNEKIISTADVLVIALGNHSAPFININMVPLRGQALTVKLEQDLSTRLTGELSLSPTGDGLYTIGSSFQRFDEDLKPRSSDTRALLEKLARLLPNENPLVIDTHVGIRATTRDRFPLVGRVPDWQKLRDYIDGSSHSGFNDYQPGLFATTGFGSHGATHAALFGEFVANLVFGEPSIVSSAQKKLLALERFNLRDARIR